MSAGTVRAAGHLTLGRAGEDAALAHILDLGWIVLARNWRYRQLELDIVAEDGDVLVFVEVKTRRSRHLAGADEVLSPAKRARLARAACAWLSASGLWERPCRFDLLTVIMNPDGPLAVLEIEHLRHVFDYTDTLGRGHAAWQPW